jgi:hypothetical protein
LQRIKAKPSASLISKTGRALDRILTEPSELIELWEESEEVDAWRAAVNALKVRVCKQP